MLRAIHLILVLIPALIALGLIGVAAMTNAWTIVLQEPQMEDDRQINEDDLRFESILYPYPLTRGLLSECISYRNVTIVVSTSFDFRDGVETSSTAQCLESQWRCRRTGECIDRKQRCNGLIECEDKTDEETCNPLIPIPDCPVGYEKCSDGKSCYRPDQETCDGRSHCLDDSDERNCTEEKCRWNHRVYCPKENRCARRKNSHRCDGIVDCQDRSDEDDCFQCQNDFNTFLCDSKCFLSKYRCDDTVQCSDFRDELNCVDYSSKDTRRRKIYHADRSCVEHQFDPFDFSPLMIKPSISIFSLYNRATNMTLRTQFFKLHFFYGIIGGLAFLSFSILILLFSICSRCPCERLSIYSYAIAMSVAFLLIAIGLGSFAWSWFEKNPNFFEQSRNSSLDLMIDQLNPKLKPIEFFGRSFWFACGALAMTLLGLIFSCFICHAIHLERSNDKEYEIMRMDDY